MMRTFNLVGHIQAQEKKAVTLLGLCLVTVPMPANQNGFWKK
jgi:hypothetical protein